MFHNRQNLKKYITISISFVFFAGIAATITSAEEPEHSVPATSEAAVPEAPKPKPGNQEDSGGLSVGQSPSGNLIYKATTDYEQQQNVNAIKKLEKIRDLQLGSNQWMQVAQILQDVLASDASQSIKGDVKRMALLELAGISENQGQLQQAQQFLAEYLKRYDTDAIIPEVLLRQGYIYRKMGAFDRAIDKLYDVLTSALRIDNKTKNFSYSERVTLTAKTEIAETYYLQGKYADAAEQYVKLLADPSEELNTEVIKTKLIRALAKLGKNQDLIKNAVEFLNSYPGSEYQAEVRYLLASSYKASGLKQESLRELLLLLEAIDVEVRYSAKWKSWKMLAGNEIGNQLFLEGDSQNAVKVYQGLLNLEDTPAWKFPIYYQIGLCFERLMAPEEALKAYREIIQASQKLDNKLESDLKMVVDMARFRADVLSWRESLSSPSAAPAAAPQKVAEKSNP